MIKISDDDKQYGIAYNRMMDEYPYPKSEEDLWEQYYTVKSDACHARLKLQIAEGMIDSLNQTINAENDRLERNNKLEAEIERLKEKNVEYERIIEGLLKERNAE